MGVKAIRSRRRGTIGRAVSALLTLVTLSALVAGVAGLVFAYYRDELND